MRWFAPLLFTCVCTVAAGLVQAQPQAETQAASAVQNPNQPQALDRSAEVAHYLAVFTDQTQHQKTQAAEDLTWLGLSDPKLFDEIERQLLAADPANNRDRDAVNDLSWYAKALAASGQDKYRPTLQQLADTAASNKLRRYAGQALDRLPDHARWNRIINGSADPALTPVQNRFRNMLHPQEPELVRLVGKRLYFSELKRDPVISAEALAFLQQHLNDYNGDGLWEDALAWLGKGLGVTGNPELRAPLQTLLTEAKSRKVQKYLRQAVDRLQ